MEKLIVVEFEMTEEMSKKKIEEQYAVGEKYTHFQDPVTGKYYTPKEGFMVICKPSEDLLDKFEELPTD